MNKKMSQKDWDKLELAEYRELQKHPAFDLLTFYPHTTTYKLLVLIQEMQEEYFSMGQKWELDDALHHFGKERDKYE